MYNMKEHLLQAETSCYAKGNSSNGCRFDCGIGENPFGIPESVREAWAAMDPGMLAHYPESMEIAEDIVQYLSAQDEITEENLALGDGTVELIFKASRMFVGEKSPVLGYVPQFSAVVDDFGNQGAEYSAYRLRQENNFRFLPDEFLNMADGGTYDLVYIDNPNNPTGQIIAPHAIEQIVSFFEERGTAILVDEAYGDYRDAGQSAVHLVPRCRNLLVFRSFSKGLGLAGLRGGYLISSPDMIRCYKKLSSPYGFNAPARLLASAALRDSGFLKRCRSTVFRYKNLMKENLRNFRIAETAPEVPISLLYVDDPDCDLQEYLHGFGIHTISGKKLPSLGKNSVRMNLHSDVEELLAVLIQADRKWRPSYV
jgi:histidinol-phosphate aminotransferase